MATLRNWQNAVNSAYNGLQALVKKQMSHGLLFNVSYTYSHSIDEGSTWHSGATTASGGAAAMATPPIRPCPAWTAATPCSTFVTVWF